ncbi:hypothetical protein [Longitalea arenae]|uniref:hypothetical protein n=1 Tax=Longitalea arenae TaxID=2812558 RepID=UPI001967697B|nr:hypothetical protein [Longitalea arenae]
MANDLRNIFSWDKAIACGCQPSHYHYTADRVPLGTYEAVLGFEIWAKKIMAINCYFTITRTYQKIQLTVYCKEAGRYMLACGEIDFVSYPTQTVYVIEVRADQKKKIRFIQAQMKY